MVANHPSYDRPYFRLIAMYFDKTANNNGYFTKQKPTQSGAIPSSAPDGPAIFINGQYACTPNDEFGWNGNGDGAWSACGKDSWWGNTYTAKIDGITYTIKFYNPYHDGDSKRMLVNVIIFANHLPYAQTTTVKIAGMWKMNSSQKTPVEESFTWTFNGLGTMGVSSPTAVTYDYNHIKISGNLKAGYGKNTVGSFQGANANNISWKKALTTSESYDASFTSFNGQTLEYRDRPDYYNDVKTYVEYIITRTGYTPAEFDALPAEQRQTINYYMWYPVTVPGYMRAQGLQAATSNLWNKEVNLSWGTEGRDGDGTWSIYRYDNSELKNGVLVASNLAKATRSYTVVNPAYDKDYYYEVSFIPRNGERRGELSTHVSNCLKREWSFSNFKAETDSTGAKIILKWNHNPIGNASKKSYTLHVQRSSDYKVSDPGKATWEDIHTIAITNDSTNLGSYTDASGLSANHTYFYRLVVNVLEKDMTSEVVNKKLGGSKILTFSATRGSYNNMVKLRWTVQQVGSDVTNFIIQRRPLGSNDEFAWADIYSTSGTASGYSYDDVTALPGTYNQYKVVVWSQSGKTVSYDDSDVADGFSLSTGTLSGNITYGTGTAVSGAKVVLKRQDDDGGISSGMHSVRFTGNGTGFKYECDQNTLKNLFEKDFSVQMYINPDSSTMNGDMRYQMLDVFCSLTFFASYDNNKKVYHPGVYLNGNSYYTGLSLEPGEWHHLTLSHKQGGYTAISVTRGDSIIADTLKTNQGAYVKSNVTIDSRANCISIANNAEFNGKEYYNGYMDELRLFTRALTGQEILKNYNHPLTGNEKDLALYYPFDEGLTVQSLAYDLSKTNNVSNGRHGLSMIPAVSSNYIPNEDQLSLMAYTDSLGYYEIRGIPYSGEGTSYSVIPKMGIHEFSPVSKSRYVSQASLIHNGVDFEDISSFPVSGKIYYSGTDYPVEGANLYVDGMICASDGKVIESAEDGTFTISVPIGNHFIEVAKSGHVFANGRYPADPEGRGVKKNFNQAISGLEFRDTTLVNYTGRVVGGDIEGDKPVGFGQSHNNIGVTKLVLTPLNDLYRMNVVKQKRGETSFSYETNNETVAVASATERINSKSWRGAGTADCRKIIILTDSLTGEFSALLPPLQYKVSVPVVVAIDSVLGDAKESALADLSKPLVTYKDSVDNKDGGYDYYEYNTLYKKIYHSKPIFTVAQSDHDDGFFGIKKYEVKDAQGSIVLDDLYDPNVAEKDSAYKYGGAIFIMKDSYKFNISGREEYCNYDANKNDPEVSVVPLAGTVVTIDNSLSSEQAVYIEGNSEGMEPGSVSELKSNQLTLDSLGLATYVWKAGYPNICAPYTRTISISYDIDNRTYQWNDGKALNGIVLGSLPTGNNFITAGPDMLDMVLRDPPGTKSKTEWTSGTVTSVSQSTGAVWNSENEIETETKLGAKVETVTGIGLAIIEDVESKVDLTVGAKVTCEGEDASSWSRSITATRTISTSEEPEYVGAQGDVFIGSSTNIIFGMARNVGFTRIGTSSDVELTLNDVITTGLSFGTEFAYTQNYIENVLIPNLKKLRDGKLKTVAQIDGYENTGKNPVYITVLSPGDEGFGASNNDKDVFGASATAGPSTAGPSYKMVVPNGSKESYTDSVEWCNTQIRNWEKHLANNEMQKVMAFKLAEAKSDSVVATNLSFDCGTSITNTKETEDKIGSKYENTVSAAAIIGATTGFAINSVGVQFEIKTETGGGEHIEREEEESQTASFSYTLAEEGDDDALTVDVYEYGKFGPIFRTRGGQTCGPYEGEVVTKYYEPGTVIMEATMQIEVPQIDVDVRTMTDVPSGGTANYVLRLSNASQIDEDVYYRLIVNDETNPNGANLMIDGKPITDSRIIKIPAGTTVTKALQLKQTDPSILKYEHIEIVLASQSQYDPTSTWDVIADTVDVSAYFVPSSSPVELDLSNTVMNNETGSKLRLSFFGFDRNYNGLKAFRLQYKRQGGLDWTRIHEYVLNTKDEENGNEMLPSSGTQVDYTFNMNSLPDGDYLFRVVSVSTDGDDEVYRYSNEMALVKDMQSPRSMGQPEPSDGVLDIGDELSVTFNEPILKGRITAESNFIVTGVLNGSKIEHETALSLKGGSSAKALASTEVGINLAKKDFAIDAWVNIASAGTLFSHGQGAQRFTAGVDAAGHLIVTVADSVCTSSNSIPFNQWIFLTMSLTKDGMLTAEAAVDDDFVPLLSGKVKAYDGNGRLSVGCGADAAIHELLLWDEAHDMTAALLDRTVTKSPSTRHLIGYWKMNEGEGTSIRDYSRNRHMAMTSEAWYINNENLSVNLDGDHCIEMGVATLPVVASDDYVVEFWMRTAKQNADAQLLQMGDIAFWLNAAGELQFTPKGAYLPTGTSQDMAVSGVVLNDNTWHHVALSVLRQGAASVYVDGVRRLTVSEANVGNIVTNSLIAGAHRITVSAENAEYEYDRAYVGFLDEIRIWDATMNSDLIVNNRKVRFTGKESGLAAYYPFEIKDLDGFNQVVTKGEVKDLCGNGGDAVMRTISGGILSGPSFADDAPALRTKPTETNVSFSYVASDEKVIITIDEKPERIEGCTLNFTVRDLLDKNGNYSEDAIWSAFVNRKELAWQDEAVSVEQKVKEESSFSVAMENLGGQQQMWTISGLPSWLTASADYGVVNPRSKSTITFTVSPSTPIGKYEETIYLKGNNGIETPLTVNVKVNGQTPEWNVNPREYENSMSIIATLDLLGLQSEDEDDIVAAFIGEECRGIAHPVYRERYDSYFVTMDIYGNSEAGEPVTFRAFDASTGTLYPEVVADKDINFDLLDLNGTYSDPVKLTALDKIEQTIKLKEGWNWVSLYVKTDIMTVASLLAQIADDVLMIKSQNAYLVYENGSWGGNLKGSLNNTEMYAVKMKKDRELRLVGQRLEIDANPITLYKGWNWISYYGRQVATLEDAYAGLAPVTGDVVKAQSGVAYYDEYEWVGSLRLLEPGQGYKAKSVVDATRTFSYPGSLVSYGPSFVQARNVAGKSHMFQAVDFRTYSNNLTMAAKLIKDGKPLANAELGLFADGECRASEITDEKGMVYLTVPGDNKVEMTMKVALGAEIIPLKGSLEYVSDAILGTPQNPLMLDMDSPTGMGLINVSDGNGISYDMQGREISDDADIQGKIIISDRKKLYR
ncbi:MAG: hypothetical protein J6V95_08535 [Bacteroidaceae bacterium]|nr:hypothetical protein [Bacteroidaceae bacterium]